MSARSLLFAPSALLIGFAVGAANTSFAAMDEPVLGLNDFAVGRSLIAESSGSLQSVLLDFDVYRRSVEPRLADLRVFDDEGRPVPYAIRRRLPTTKSISQSIGLPLFRLPPDRNDSTQIQGSLGPNDYRIDAKLSATGAILSIHRKNDPVASARFLPAAGWLLDTSDLDRAVVRLDFVLPITGGDFVSRLRLEGSDDLAHWKRVEGDLVLARLEQGGHQIERIGFDIPNTEAEYLRLTPIGDPPPVDILGVRASLSNDTPARRQFQQHLNGRTSASDSNIVLFDLESSPPIETVRVLLGEMNSIVEGKLESAAAPEGPWRLRQSGVFYNFDQGGELRNPAAEWKGQEERYVRLVTSSRGGGLQGTLPTLEVVWRPEQLLYLDRSQGGSTLAIGRAGTKDGSFAAEELLRMGDVVADDHMNITVRLGPEFTLAGERVLTVPISPPWRKVGLWLLLLSIVGIVLGLGFRLIRTSNDS